MSQQSTEPESPSKADRIWLRVSLSSTTVPGATVQWLKSHNQQEQMFEAIAAFWSPFAIRDQGIDPVWSEAQAHLSIGRLQQQILLIQRSFRMVPTSNGALHPLNSPTSEGVVSQSAPNPSKSAIPMAAPPEPIPVVSSTAVGSPLVSQPIPSNQGDFEGYNIHIGGFDDFDAELEDESVG